MEDNIKDKYQKLLGTYQARRKQCPLDGASDPDESYKWGIVTSCKGKKGLELVKSVVTNSVQNQMEWREKNSLKICLENTPDSLEPIIEDLLQDISPLEERLSRFAHKAKGISMNGKSSFGSERTAATLLTCYDPQKYCFYTSELYEHLHSYLGDQPAEGSKYVYLLDKVKEIASMITPEIQKVEDELPQGSIRSNLLIAQDVCWEIFMNTPYAFRREMKKRLEAEKDFIYSNHDGNYFIWLGTEDKLIGNEECHYEFCWDGQKKAGHDYNTVFVEVHFEEKKCSLKDEYNQLLDNQPKIKKFPWTPGIKGIRINDQGYKFLNYPNVGKLVDDVFAELKELDKIVHPAIKQLKIMEKSNQSLQYYTSRLLHAKNLILTGAPGTGKTYLAKEIAAAIIGCELKDVDRSGQFGFVQFHPSYDYTDFVEGLRPTEPDENNNVGFELRDGIFKSFCEKALKNIADSEKSAKELAKEDSAQQALETFLEEATDSTDETEGGEKKYQTLSKKSEFYVESYDEKHITIVIPNNKKVKSLSIKRDDLILALSSNKELHNLQDVKELFHEQNQRQHDSYILAIYKLIAGKKMLKSSKVGLVNKKNFVFVIDEINRGDLSKILGELFFSIDPGYRGVKGKITTQYANMQTSGNIFDRYLGISDYGHFFVPTNVYIIGTMNDIDRSVETMDFAMRRRFAWKEVTADDSMGMLDSNPQLDGVRDEIKNRMSSLNRAIEGMEGLGRAYDIGAAYFMKYADYQSFEDLWQFHIEGVLKEYLRGERDADDKLKQLHQAYNNTGKPTEKENDNNA